MFFECEMCHSFADDGDILNNVCLNCIDSFGTASTADCNVSNSTDIDNRVTCCN